MPAPVDMTGRRSGRLVVLVRAGSNAHRCATWLCRCDCGTETIVLGAHLRRGLTRSCGCLRRDATAATGRSSATHGHTIGGGTPTYHSWLSMRKRCHNPNQDNYAYYGGRGITVCERWDDFAAFLADMGERPPGMSLDRVNNDHGYSAANCRWATRTEQAHNRRPRKAAK